MPMKGTAHISQLPVQLLARILSCLDLAERLKTCALVCSTWQQAAILTVHDIVIDAKPNQTHRQQQLKVDAAARWLGVHASGAQISSINLVPSMMHPLTLPLQHLSGLRALMLGRLEVTAANSTSGSTGASTAIFDHPALTGLTSLQLACCSINVQGLNSCSALQHLEFTPYTGLGLPPDGLCSELSALSEAIPRLQQLTSLSLSDWACQDAVVEQVSTLSRLQRLYLRHGTCTAASFRSLPSSLTQLDLAVLDTDAAGVSPRVVFSPSSTPGLCQLPALQELLVGGYEYRRRPLVFNVALLTALTQLTKLQITAPLVTTAGGPTLVVLSALTKLQHLQLPHLVSGPHMELSPADYAAVTASQQLTELHLSYVSCEFEPALFPPGRQLRNLLVIELPLKVFPLNASSMVDACPALQQLTMEDDGADDVAAVEETTWATSLRELTRLTSLTALSLEARKAKLGQQVASVLAMLTGLESLWVDGTELAFIGGAMQLTALRRLTELSLRECKDKFYFIIDNTAPAGSRPNVWSQLPGRAMEAAVTGFASSLHADEGLHPLLRVLRDGIDCSQQQQEQLQRRVHELEQQLEEEQVAGQEVADDLGRQILEQVAALQGHMVAHQAQMAAQQAQWAAMQAQWAAQQAQMNGSA